MSHIFGRECIILSYAISNNFFGFSPGDVSCGAPTRRTWSVGHEPFFFRICGRICGVTVVRLYSGAPFMDSLDQLDQTAENVNVELACLRYNVWNEKFELSCVSQKLEHQFHSTKYYSKNRSYHFFNTEGSPSSRPSSAPHGPRSALLPRLPYPPLPPPLSLPHFPFRQQHCSTPSRPPRFCAGCEMAYESSSCRAHPLRPRPRCLLQPHLRKTPDLARLPRPQNRGIGFLPGRLRGYRPPRRVRRRLRAARLEFFLRPLHRARPRHASPPQHPRNVLMFARPLSVFDFQHAQAVFKIKKERAALSRQRSHGRGAAHHALVGRGVASSTTLELVALPGDAALLGRLQFISSRHAVWGHAGEVGTYAGPPDNFIPSQYPSRASQ